MNFKQEFIKGQKGESKGIPLGAGFENVSKVINGLQKARIYSLGAAAKVGKSTTADCAFLIQPFLYALEHNIPAECIYFSFEIDRVSKEFDFSTYFLNLDYGINKVKLPPGVTLNKKTEIPISPNYIRGRVLDDKGEVIKMSPDLQLKVQEVYTKRIIPFFGEYDDEGNQIKKGLITFIEKRENPTGLWKYLINHAKENGEVISKKWTGDNGESGETIIGFKEKDPKKITLVITDHIRKLKLERGFTLKQAIDKYSELTVEIRNLFKYSFLHICHINRAFGAVENIKFAGDNLYPQSENFKDSGNLSEDSDYIFTMMNPNDEKYRLEKHFDIQLKDSRKNELYPNLRTLHLVESRHCDFPQHFKLNMFGNIKTFKKFKE